MIQPRNGPRSREISDAVITSILSHTAGRKFAQVPQRLPARLSEEEQSTRSSTARCTDSSSPRPVGRLDRARSSTRSCSPDTVLISTESRKTYVLDTYPRDLVDWPIRECKLLANLNTTPFAEDQWHHQHSRMAA